MKDMIITFLFNLFVIAATCLALYWIHTAPIFKL